MMEQSLARENGAAGLFLARPAGWSTWTPVGAAWLYCAAAALAILFAVAAFLMASLRGDLAVADADELLQKLATLARAGNAVICDPAILERTLSIRIDDHVADRVDDHISSALVAPANALSSATSGTYSKFRFASKTICRLDLRFDNRRFCDSDSARVQRLLDSRVQPSLAMIGEAGVYSHGYSFTNERRERSIIGWRQPARSCPSEIEIASERG
ncbi:hypothetical protein J7E62_05105 [Variovorax paradoxus]|nr:hypothetical protein [Variovorax paradoxus]